MASYNNFKEYLKERFYDKFENKIKWFFIERKDLILDRLHYRANRIREIEVQDLEFMQVYTDDKGTYLDITVLVVPNLSFSTYDYRNSDWQADSVYDIWVSVKCKASLERELRDFKIQDISIYEGKVPNSHPLDGDLVPYITKDKFESYAEELLQKFYPEAFNTPIQIDVNKLASKMGLTVKKHKITKDGSIFGQLYFKDAVVELYNEERDLDIETLIPAKTILVDEETAFLHSFGSYNLTVAHECLHFYAHKKAFKFAQILNKELNLLQCETKGGLVGVTENSSAFRMEIQANGIALADKSMQFELVDTMGAGRLPVSVKHMYNSLRTTYYDFVTLDNGGAVVIDYKCGNGFKLNYQQFLVVDSVDSGTLSDGESDVQYIWINANGEKITFYKNATTGKVTCEHNFTLTLDNDGIIEISDLSNNKLEFEQVLYSRIYRLKRMIDVNSNKIVLTYNEFEDLSEIQSFTNNGSTDVEINKVTLSYSATTGYIDKITETVNGVSVETTISLDENNSIKQIKKSDNANVNFDYTEGKTGYVVKAVYQSNGIGYYFDCGLGEYEELHLLSTTDGIEGGSVKELTPATSGDYVMVNNVNCPIQRLYDVDFGERWARVINEKTDERILYTFDYFGNCVSVIEENYDVSGTKTPQAKSFTKTGKYLDLSVSRKLNLLEHLSGATTTANSITDFSQFDSTDMYIVNPFKTALESKTNSDRKIYYSDEGQILFTINKDYLASTIIDSATTGLAVSAWVKADSLPVEPIASGLQVNDVVGEFSYNTTVEPKNLPGLVNKRFDLCAKVVFDKGESKIFRNSFDWTRKDFQYTETYVILDDVEWPNVKEIQVYVDYSNNNGRIYMYGGAMIFGNLSLSFRNEKLQTVLQESSDGKLSTTYTYENNKVVAEKTFTKNYGSDSEEKPFIYIVDNSYEYDNKGNVKKVTDNKNGLITEYAYSAFGDVLSTKVSHPDLTNSDNQTLEFLNEVVYNEIGDVKEVKNEFGETVGTYTYAHNAVSKINDFNNSETVFGYDTTYSLLTSVQSTVSGVLNKNSTDFTAGIPIKDTDVVSTDISGNTTIEYDYDGFGNVTAIYVNGLPYCSIEYKNNYNKKIVTYENGDILIYNQDIDNGVEFSRYYTRNPNNQGNTEFEMKFDSFGRFKDLETEDMGGTKIAQKYNEDGTIRKSYVECEDDVFYDLSRETEYGDDRKVSKQTLRHKDGNSEYIVDELKPSYDDNDRLTAVEHTGKFSENIEYDKLGRVKELTKVAFRLSSEDNESVEEMNAYQKTFSYKTVGTKTSNLISKETEFLVSSGVNLSINDLGYVYDRAGRITEVTQNKSGETETIRRYVYDGLGRLIQEYNADFGKTFNYSYDNAGNITQKSYEQTNSQGQSEQIAKTYAYTNGRLTNYNGYTILYDEIGNPVTCFNNSLEWTHGHRLKKYHGAEFEYNYAGIRLKKTANGKTTKYALEGDKIIAIEQTYGNTTQNMIFYYGVDGVSGFEYEGEQYFYRKNIFGDILGVYKNAELIVKYAYDAWGVNKTYVSDGSNWVLLENSAALDSNSDYARNVRIAKLNPFLYRGYCYDRETRLYYLQSRYYDPQVGRFICPDSIEYLDPKTINGLNLYAYCANNPVMYSDPSGHFSLPNWAKWVIGGVAFVGAVALTYFTGGALAPMFIQMGASIVLGGLVQGTANAIRGESFWKGFADGAANGALTGGVLAFGQSVFRVVKVGNYASKGLTIGKKGTYEIVGEMTGTAHYGGLKSHGFLTKLFGKNFADKVGWVQNKSIVQGVMKFKGVIYDCGGELTGAYAKEIVLTKGYQYFVNIWLL